MFGAKLSWCQIVRCQIVLVPNCPGAKLSVFIILVPNCPLLLFWCQIVRFIILVPNCPVPNSQICQIWPNVHFANRDLQIWRISPPPLPSNSVKWYLTISHSDYWRTYVLGAAYDHFCFLQMLLCQNPVTISD